MSLEIRWLTAQEVGQRMQLKPRTVRKWARRGLLPPPVKLGRQGRCLRWREEDLLAFLQARQSH
jgi:predicted DNA-binding transcriptional regulator AlpA